MNCPHCGAPLEVPRAAFWNPGQHTASCPNGHEVTVTMERRPIVTPDHPPSS
jgi:hypothetical protein